MDLRGDQRVGATQCSFCCLHLIVKSRNELTNGALNPVLKREREHPLWPPSNGNGSQLFPARSIATPSTWHRCVLPAIFHRLQILKHWPVIHVIHADSRRITLLPSLLLLLLPLLLPLLRSLRAGKQTKETAQIISYGQ